MGFLLIWKYLYGFCVCRYSYEMVICLRCFLVCWQLFFLCFFSWFLAGLVSQLVDKRRFLVLIFSEKGHL